MPNSNKSLGHKALVNKYNADNRRPTIIAWKGRKAKEVNTLKNKKAKTALIAKQKGSKFAGEEMYVVSYRFEGLNYSEIDDLERDLQPTIKLLSQRLMVPYYFGHGMMKGQLEEEDVNKLKFWVKADTSNRTEEGEVFNRCSMVENFLKARGIKIQNKPDKNIKD